MKMASFSPIERAAVKSDTPGRTSTNPFAMIFLRYAG
jgi:hypothetical protein